MLLGSVRIQDESGCRTVKRKGCFDGEEQLEDQARGELEGSSQLKNVKFGEAEEFGAVNRWNGMEKRAQWR